MELEEISKNVAYEKQRNGKKSFSWFYGMNYQIRQVVLKANPTHVFLSWVNTLTTLFLLSPPQFGSLGFSFIIIVP